MTPRSYVVLFDIDGTLLTSADGGPTAGFEAMNLAMGDLTGDRLYGDPMSFAGRTDLQIARSLLISAGEPDPVPGEVQRLVDRYLHHLRRLLADHPYRPLGDPSGAVQSLTAVGGVVGLGTGNVREGAALKLSSAAIGDLFRLDLGGYGEDGDTRAELLEVGARRCDPERCLPVIIVGDTPHDVSAARAMGARCVGVPYRRNTAAVLREAGAAVIVDEVGPALAPAIEALLAPGTG